ncbi:MAG: FG-GAP-like repeat-containing protein [Cyanobacteria bacterium]|nr:FG-GAP-like repeat-containing protein [Cyanobacteriota bacterium]
MINGFATPDAPTGLDLNDFSETGSSSTDNITSISTPRITGTAEAGSTVVLYDSDGSTSLGSTTADENGVWSITTSTLASGSHTLTAKATNSATNTSSASVALSITIDDNAPKLDLSGSRNPAFTGGSIEFGLAGVRAMASSQLADIDGDGDLDLFIGNSDGSILFFKNTGSASSAAFTESAIGFALPDMGGSARPSFADIDADGDLDLFVGARSGSILFLENTGNVSSAAFAGTSIGFNLPRLGTSTSPTFVDINGDGDLDLFVGNHLENIFYFENTGSASRATFAGSSIGFELPSLGGAASPTFGDIDGDGDLDLFVGEYSGSIIFFENTGSSTSAAFSQSKIGFGLPDVGLYSAPIFADINADGDLDLFVSDYSGNTLFFENTGSGGVTTTNANGTYVTGDTITIEVPFSEVVTVDTTDGPPLLILDTGSRKHNASYSSGSGTKTLTFIYTLQAGDSSADLDYSSSSALIVPENSSIKDAAGNNANPNLPTPGTTGSLGANADLLIDTIAPHVKISSFAEASLRFGMSDAGLNASPSFADINGDGDLDLFIGNSGSNILFFENTGSSVNPGFAEATEATTITPVGYDLRTSFADIDADGDQDLLIGNYDGETYYFENIGSANSAAFAEATNKFDLPDVGNLAKPTLVDIDSDGDFDLFIGGADGNTYFFSNTGSASSAAFTGSSIGFDLPTVGTIAAPAFADIDGDGDLDLFIGNYDGNTFFFENTGSASSASFATAATDMVLANTGYSASPALADIDGDGDLDLFIGGYYGNTLFLENTGSSGIRSTNDNGSYGIGSVIAIAVPFSEVVTVTGSPELVLETGSTDRTAIYVSGSGTNTLVFSYTVQAGDRSSDLDLADRSALTITNGSIQDGAGNDASLSLPAPGTSGSLGATSALVIDAVGPTGTLNHANSMPAYAATSANPFDSTNVGLSAAPSLIDIDADGDLDLFVGNFAGKTLFFRNSGSSANPSYEMASSNALGITDVRLAASPEFADIDGDGDFDLFVGDLDGNTHFFRNSGSNSAPGFEQDVMNPFAISDASIYASPSFADIDGDGDLDLFTGNRYGNTIFFLNTGSTADPAYGPARNNPFGITQQNIVSNPHLADIDGDGDLDLFVSTYNGNTSFFLNTGSSTAPGFAEATINPFGITDVISLANPTFADIDNDTDLDLLIGNREGAILFFSNTAPLQAVAEVKTSTPSGSYGIGDTILLTVQFSEGLIVDTTNGEPRLQLETGSTDQYATFAGLTSTTATDDTLIFNYTVQAGDSSGDLDQLSASALDLNGSTIKDAIGNNAILSLAASGAAGSLAANGELVIDGVAPQVQLGVRVNQSIFAEATIAFGLPELGELCHSQFGRHRWRQ